MTSTDTQMNEMNEIDAALAVLAAARPAPEPTWRGTQMPVVSYEQASAYLMALGRKIEVSEVTAGLRSCAAAYAQAYEGTWDFMVDMRAAARSRRGLSVAQAKAVLNCWRTDLARAAAPVVAETDRPAPASEPGYYAGPGGVAYLVVATKDGHRVYAKRLVLPPAESEARARWEYDGGAIRRLTADMRREPLAFAAEFGHLNGYCMKCGARLDDPGSVHHGMGYTCYRKLGGTLTAGQFKKAAAAG